MRPGLWRAGACRALGTLRRASAARPAAGSWQRVRAYVGEAPGASPTAAAPPPPTSAELLRDSRLAAISGLAYVPPEELEHRLERHGLELQAHGTTHFTRWFVARHSAAAPAAAQAPTGSLIADPAQRLVFLRGVSWRSADLNALRVWQGLVRALPSAFLPHLTSPPELLMAHSGVAEMAEELFGVLRPHMEGVPRLHLAGHSLGGSLATLVALTAHLKLGASSLGASSGGSDSSSTSSSSDGAHPSGLAGSSSPGSAGFGSGAVPSRQQQQQRQQAQHAQQQRQRLQVEVTTFGSPPVLALAHGAEEDGRSILQALRLPLGAVKNYVLQDDPVPRALLSADPAFMAMKSSPAVAGLLRLREQWLGQGVLSPTRFLFHPAGDVFLIRWSAERGHSVRLLAPHTLQEELKLDVETLRNSPMALMQALMDHHHGSYATELRAAAAALARQEAAAAAAAGASTAAGTSSP
ncbi:hypothetical protein ABPG75_008360 [Micractinium tetrahymenae]